MKRILVSLTYAVALSVAPAPAQTDRPPNVNTRPFFAWPHVAQSLHIETNVTREQVEEFLTAAGDSVYYEPVKVEQFAFARLWPERATLVAKFGVGGRPFYWGLMVADWDGISAHLQAVSAEPPYDLNTGVTDVDGDGLAEIITQTLALGYEGANTRPVVWKRILKMRADYTLEDVSRENRAYFETHIIPELEALDAKLPSTYESQNLRDALAQVQFVRDKYRRMLYGEAEAGMANAQRWAQDSQWELQALAILAFKDIGTKEARETITKLSQSGNQVVAGRARGALRVMDLAKQ